MPEIRYARTGEVARVAAEADAGEILVTSTVRDLVAGAGVGFGDAGERELTDVPGTLQLYAVVDG